MTVTKQSILLLYKNLYKYGQQLKYTDKSFYFKYIRKQFDANKSLPETDTKNINRLVQVIL